MKGAIAGLLIGLTAAVACHRRDRDDPGGSATDQSLAVYRRAAEIAEQAPDCEVAAAQLRQLIADHRDALDRGVALSAQAQHDPAVEQMLEQRSAEIADLGRRMDLAFGRCAESDAFQAAIADLP